MKALSVRQPWAHLIIHGGKDVENRSRRTLHRGPLAIHAAGTMTPAERAMLPHFPLINPAKLPMEAIIGIVELVDCVQGYDSKWAMEGMWHWVLANPKAFRTPIRMAGNLSLWNWDGLPK